MKILSLLVVCLTLSACDTEVKHNDNFERTTSELNSSIQSSIQSLSKTITEVTTITSRNNCEKK